MQQFALWRDFAAAGERSILTPVGQTLYFLGNVCRPSNVPARRR